MRATFQTKAEQKEGMKLHRHRSLHLSHVEFVLGSVNDLKFLAEASGPSHKWENRGSEITD